MSAPPDDAAGEGEGKPRPRTDSSVASLEVGNGSGSGGNMGDPNNNVPLVAINPVTGLPVEDPTVHVIDAKKKVELVTIHFKGKKIISKGSFGSTIILATIGDTEEQVVIKKIPQNKKYKNRELFILKQLQQLPHPYILSLKHHFSTSESRGLLKASEKFLNLVFEYIPENLDSLLRQYNQSKQTFPVFLTQLYMYQLGRAVAHLHGMGVSHRDIQPRNLLIDPVSMWLKLCDFSSAKSLNPDQASQSYVCSRFYRAPELILGSTNYTTAVDIWSIGCVFVEMITGSPFFAGKSGADHLFEIVKVLGSPTPEHLMGMNINISEDKKINFPALTQAPFESFFRIETPESAIDIASKMIQYIPSKRPLAIEVCLLPTNKQPKYNAYSVLYCIKVYSIYLSI